MVYKCATAYLLLKFPSGRFLKLWYGDEFQVRDERVIRALEKYVDMGKLEKA